MKSANPLTLLVLISILSLGFAGCKKFDPGLTLIPQPNRTVTDQALPNPPAGIGVEPGVPLDGTNGMSSSEFEDPNALPGRIDDGRYWAEPEFFAAQTVYFYYDSSAINSAERPKLDVVAAHLSANPTHMLRVEGHCDERGTDEYNRALGSRRALSAREVLIVLGVAKDRVSTISYGEDKPAMFGSDETSWAKNRRAEFVLLTPKE